MKGRNFCFAAIRTTVLVSALALVGALVAIVPAGCSYNSVPSATTEEEIAAEDYGGWVPPIILTEDDNGWISSCMLGDTITVQLEAAPMFGDRWKAALSPEDAPLFEPVAEPVFVAYPAPYGIISDVGTYTFTFETVARGKADIRIELWNVNQQPPQLYRIFSVTVTIK
jgi:predicted secreted protein